MEKLHGHPTIGLTTQDLESILYHRLVTSNWYLLSFILNRTFVLLSMQDKTEIKFFFLSSAGVRLSVAGFHYLLDCPAS